MDENRKSAEKTATPVQGLQMFFTARYNNYEGGYFKIGIQKALKHAWTRSLSKIEINVSSRILNLFSKFRMRCEAMTMFHPYMMQKHHFRSLKSNIPTICQMYQF